MYQCLSSTNPFRHTLQGTNISFGKVLKMMFLFTRWDMLVPWRVCSPPSWRHFPVPDVLLHWRLFVDGCPSPAVEFGLEPACEEASPRKEYVQNKHLDTFSGWFVSEIDYHPGQWMFKSSLKSNRLTVYNENICTRVFIFQLQIDSGSVVSQHGLTWRPPFSFDSIIRYCLILQVLYVSSTIQWCPSILMFVSLWPLGYPIMDGSPVYCRMIETMEGRLGVIEPFSA